MFIAVAYGYGYVYAWRFGMTLPMLETEEVYILAIVYICFIILQGIIANGTRLPWIGTYCRFLDEAFFFYRRLPLWAMGVFLLGVYTFIILGGSLILSVIPQLTVTTLYILSVGFSGPAVSMFLWRLTHPKTHLTG